MFLAVQTKQSGLPKGVMDQISAVYAHPSGTWLKAADLITKVRIIFYRQGEYLGTEEQWGQ